MQAAAPAMGPAAAQVSLVPADADVRRFVLDDGLTGFALKGGDAVGGFSQPSAPRGAAIRMLEAAVAEGGRRLDAFDTFLPKLYARAGFRAVARLPFNPEYAPSVEGGALADWDGEAMAALPGAPESWAQPDIVFMVYDPANASADTDVVIDDYDDGVRLQDEALTADDAAAGTDRTLSRVVSMEFMPDRQTAELIFNVPKAGRQIPELSAVKELGIEDPDGADRELLRSNRTPGLQLEAFRARATNFPERAIYAMLTDGAVFGPQYLDVVDKVHAATAEYIRKRKSPVGAFDKAELLKANDRWRDRRRRGIQKPMRGADKAAFATYVVETLRTRPQIETFITNQLGRAQAQQFLTRAEELARRNMLDGELPEGVVDLAAAVDVPGYLDLDPKAGSLSDTLKTATDVARRPWRNARTLVETVEDGIFNGFAPIRRLETQLRGELPMGMESAYKLAEVATNDSGRQEMLLYYGAPRLGEHGEMQVADGTTGLRNIFDLASSGVPRAQRGQAMVDWMSYMVARRAKDLKRRGFAVPVTDAEIDAAIARERPEFRQAADQWKRFNDSTVDFLVDTGRITRQQADALKQEEAYVPFYRSTDKRVDEEPIEFDLEVALGTARGPGRARGGGTLARDPGIKRMIGGDKQAIDNVLNNMVRNAQAMTAAGYRNFAANRTFDLISEAGLGRVESATKRSKKTGDIVRKEKPKNSVRMWRNGKEKFVVVEEEAAPLVVAMANLAPRDLSGLLGIMANIGAVFRQSITLSPAFMLRNAIRGAVSTGILTSGSNLTLTSNTITGMRDALRKGDATQAFTRLSGMGDYRFGNSDIGLGQDDILIDYGIAPATIGYRIRQVMNRAEAVGTATELADRIAAYQSLVRNGVRPDEAAYQALAIINYQRRGGWQFVRQMLPLVPFLNARLQGLSRLTEGAVGRRGPLGRQQALKQLALNGAVLSLVSGALWAWNNSDEERRDKYRSEPIWRRQNYHLVYAGGTTLMIPKAFEIGHLFSSIPEMMLDSAVNDMGDELLPATAQMMGQTFGFNAIPAAVLPIIEGAANYSFFTGSPIEGYRDQNLLPEDRITGASNLSQLIGRELGLSDVTRLSPAMIEHYMQGYGGAAFNMLAFATDMVGGELGLTNSSPAGAFGTVPVASRVAENVVGSAVQVEGLTAEKYVNEFYTTKNHITQIYQSAKAAATMGDVERAQQMLAGVPGFARARTIVNRAARPLGELNTEIRNIYSDRRLSPREKTERLEPLIRRRNALARRVVEAVEQIEEAQGQSFRGAA